ncbi:MAG: LarC family nickel insertion protein [Tissierellia bacterium]|nr:LarC family nickel insertion protein [Tissierellia bacterium]
MTGEELGFLMEKLFDSNALDVYFTPIYMKKNRPGTMVSVLSKIEHRDEITHTIFKHSSTLGIRVDVSNRVIMNRSFKDINTTFGNITVKSSHYEDIVKESYEFEHLKRIADDNNISIRDILQQLKSIE